MTETFFERLARIDGLIRRGPEACDFAQQLRPLLTESASTAYFYDNLQDPSWIQLLLAEDVFRDPPSPKREGDYISFPVWPESQYLARMAAVDRETATIVLRIALQIPDSGNIRVYQDLADAALAMPPDLAARLVPKAKVWLENPYGLLLPQKLGDLVSHLARGGQVCAALHLARSLLAILPESPEPREPAEEEPSALPPTARARLDSWHYEQILKKNVPDLVRAAGLDALKLICDLLEDALGQSRRREAQGPEDYSHIWRQAIETEPKYAGELRDVLVSAVRDAAEALMETGGKMVLDIVERGTYKVFQRIALHLRRKWPQVDPEGTGALVTDPILFEDETVRHEFFLLLREQFDNLPEQSRRAYLDLVDQGIDPAGWLAFRHLRDGRRPTWEEGEASVRYWQYRRLEPLQAFLKGDWRQRFDKLREEFGEVKPIDAVDVAGLVWTGPTPPRKVKDMRSMTADELVEFLDSWKPSGELMGPSMEGLGRELKTLVASQPAPYALEAPRFEDLDPTYGRALLSGLEEAVKEKKAFPWEPVLELCHWVVTQPRKIPGRSVQVPYGDRDPDWGWTRKAIASLFFRAFESDPVSIPFTLRQLAWQILKLLTDDPEPTPEYEARWGGGNLGPATMSINTVRGEAMHAVVRYALWVRRHIGAEDHGEHRLERGFDEMPEVREVLDHHLDPDHDPLLTIRAVYGQWFPWLVLLDAHWAAQSTVRIFPSEAAFRTLRDAAWQTYLSFCRPYDNVADLLQDEYARAVEDIGAASGAVKPFADPDRRLALHLMSFFWRGKLNLDEPDGLLSRFFAKASDDLRGHALSTVGRWLYDAKEAVPSAVLDRLKALWLQRLEAARDAPSPSSHAAELSRFGLWFASGKFDDAWTIDQLKQALQLTGAIEPSHLVVERLAALADTMPLLTIECLNLLVQKADTRWEVLRWRNHARTVLTTALDSDNPPARQAADDLVNRLGALGHLEFRDLVSKRQP